MAKLDWNAHRAKIEELYKTMSLRELITHFQDQLGLQASTASWERVLRRWGLRKYIRKRLPARQGQDKCILQATTLESPWAMFLKSLETRRLLDAFRQCVNVGQNPVVPSITTPPGMEAILPPGCPAGNGYLLAQLYILANNHNEAPVETPNQDPAAVMAAQDNMIVNLLDRISSTSVRHLTDLLDSHDPITEAIRDSAFASALRTQRGDLVANIGKTGVDLDGRIRTRGLTAKTPLQFAAELDNEAQSLALTNNLLSLGRQSSLPLDLTTPRQGSPLHRSIKKGYYNVASLLLNYRAVAGPWELLLALEHMVQFENNSKNNSTLPDTYSRFVGRLQQSGAGINATFTASSPIHGHVTLLGYAVMQSKSALAQKLLFLGAEINAPQKTECVKLMGGLNTMNHVFCARSVTTTPLGLAVAFGDGRTVDILLNQPGINLDSLSVDEFRCPLLIACFHGKVDMAYKLLQKKVDVAGAEENAKEMELGSWPNLTLDRALVHGAGTSGQTEYTTTIRSQIAHCLARTAAGEGRHGFTYTHRRTLLETAIEAGDAPTVQQHLGTYTPMPMKVRHIGNKRVALVLKRFNALVPVLERNGYVILGSAMKAKQFGLVFEILQGGMDLSGEDGKCFDDAVATGDPGLIGKFLDCKAQFTGRTFRTAVQCRKPDEVLTFLFTRMPPTWKRTKDERDQKDGNPGSENSNLHDTGAADAMVAALKTKNIQVLQQILENVAVPPRLLGKVLASAVMLGELALVKTLLDNGAAPDGELCQDPSDGRMLTAWDAALRSGKETVLQWMIRAGADVSARSLQTLRTPVQVAVEAMDADLLAFLIRHEGDVNAPATSDAPATALQHASIRGYTQLVGMLLDAGADVNASADAALHGRTALEGAAENGRIEVVHQLLQGGARVRGTGEKQFQRAIRFAKEQGHNALARWLEGLIS
ncbi:hypothetical protein QBC39DRAFT_357940 [Podospora conica]|nr:hypothetical protein QBC39DRAFT_357940 [Schizothecium conicum]